MCLLPFSAISQIQQAWAVHYNNGITNGTNQAVKMALDSAGHIYVLGFSQNTNTNLGYVTIKYAPNGTQLWAARYDDTNSPSAVPSGLVLDTNNNVIITGSALTVKYDSNGNQLWAAPYSASAIAMDPGGNAILTGMASSFTTAKLNPAGSNLWQETYLDPIGPAQSQVVLADASSNVYVAGSYTDICYSTGCEESLFVVKYDQNGNQLLTTGYGAGPAASVVVGGAALDGAGNLYFLASFIGVFAEYETLKYSSAGNLSWAVNVNYNGSSRGKSLALDSETNVLVTGQCFAYDYRTAAYGYGTFKVSADGGTLWTNYFPQTPLGSTSATSMAVDFASNSYVTGYSPGVNGTNDIVTIKYGPNGNQIWLQRYSSPSGGNAAGNAIAVDGNGNVYVTGYDTTAAGGTEIVTIKYSPVTVQHRSDGTVILQAQGSPGEAFDIEASTDLLNWLDLGSVLTDTNGLMQFDDTNAPAYPARFYYTSPQ
ncbi:MAG TPA: SBBP repeat-containing protein [Verrucomicrobiae bacterium]|nr:SBBP repeat-containing protein [Verrucomicrobiae bacterium]